VAVENPAYCAGALDSVVTRRTFVLCQGKKAFYERRPTNGSPEGTVSVGGLDRR
jgi:hypothetical protein